MSEGGRRRPVSRGQPHGMLRPVLRRLQAQLGTMLGKTMLETMRSFLVQFVTDAVCHAIHGDKEGIDTLPDGVSLGSVATLLTTALE
jgi:hypothetical protein